MRNVLLAASLSLLLSPAAYSAAPSASGTTWTLAGKVRGTVGVVCRIGGRRAVPFQAQVNLQGQIAFDPAGTFSLTNDTLLAGGAGSANGTWTQRGGRLRLEFDTGSKSGLRLLAEGLAQANVSSTNGLETALEDVSYRFTGTLRNTRKGPQLTLGESAGFRIRAQKSGQSCGFSARFGRSYAGMSVQ